MLGHTLVTTIDCLVEVAEALKMIYSLVLLPAVEIDVSILSNERWRNCLLKG
jgi:hypothetical protein